MAIPDPRTATFPPPPAGCLLVVAWRQRTESWPHPDLAMLHADRAALLHRWAESEGIDVQQWGETDAERPAEFVQMIVTKAVETAVTAGLTTLISASVKAFFDYRKSRSTQSAAAPAADPEGETRGSTASPTGQIPLLALTIVNESGGTLVVMNPPKRKKDEAALLVQVMDPIWGGKDLII